MGKLIVFNFLTMNGYYKGTNDDISWHTHGKEENELAAKNLQSDAILIFGRVTYEQMAAYWPTEDAIKNQPQVAKGMNNAEKIVFSRKLKKAEWNNTRLIKANAEEELRKIKKQSTKDLVILGSGSIVTQFAEWGLIDAYQFMIDPVVLGDGTPVFKGMKGKLDLELTDTKTFKSGTVLVTYKVKMQN